MTLPDPLPTEDAPTLTEFLLARIAEDEIAARYGRGELIDLPESTWGVGVIIPNNPARVLAECEAKRRIVDGLEAAFESNSNDPTSLKASTIMGLLDACYSLAAVYSDHPDYRDEWAAR